MTDLIITEAPQGNNPTESDTPQLARSRIVDGGQVEDLSPRVFRPEDSPETSPHGAIIGSAFNPVTGQRLAPEEIDGDSIVTVPFPDGRKLEMRAIDASRAGLIRKAGHGGYESAQGQNPTQSQNAPTNEVDSETAEQEAQAAENRSGIYRPNLLDQEGEAAFSKATEGIHPSFFPRLAEAVTTGDGAIPKALAEEVLASAPGLDMEQLETKAREAADLLGHQAIKAVSDQIGNDATDLVLDKFRSLFPDEFKRAVGIMATHRSHRGFSDMLQNYIEHLPEFEPKKVLSFKQNGWSTQMTDEGLMVVGPKGQTLPWKQALKAGSIRVRGYNRA